MKSIMLSAIAISAAALASCGGDDSGNPSTITFYASSTNGFAGGFDLSETVMNAGIYKPDEPCGGLQAQSSNPFLEGVVVPGGSNAAQISYAVELPTGHCVTLNLNGIFTTIPADSLTAGNVTGTTGTVQTITESYDGRTVFQIEGLNLDATSMTDVIAGGDYGTFWRLVAEGGGRPLDGVYSGSGTFSVYCGANNTGASINLTSAPTSMGKFLGGC
jgi:hypothetical protein